MLSVVVHYNNLHRIKLSAVAADTRFSFQRIMSVRSGYYWVVIRHDFSGDQSIYSWQIKKRAITLKRETQYSLNIGDNSHDFQTVCPERNSHEVTQISDLRSGRVCYIVIWEILCGWLAFILITIKNKCGNKILLTVVRIGQLRNSIVRYYGCKE